jgi:N-acetylmuramoyl-L-alanine amidase
MALAALGVVAVRLAGISALGRAAARRADAGLALDPAAFAPGACEAFGPTAGERHATVFLDAGHGGPDPGALGTTESGQQVTEASLTLPIELDTMALLRADGYRVVVSRTADTSVARLGPADEAGGVLTLVGLHEDVAARDVCADDAGARVLVGIYLDAGASPADAGSLAAYDAVRPFAARNERLAALVEADVVAALDAHGWQIPDDGVVPDTEVGSVSGNPSQGGLAARSVAYGHLLLLGPAQAGYFSTPSTMPGTVVEPLFVTDPFEASVAASSVGQRAVAAGIARAVEQFLAPAPASTRTTRAG